MLDFYETNCFKLFKCLISKHPDVSYGDSWRDPKYHLSIDRVEDIMSRGGFIGAWLPDNYVIIDIDVKGAKHKHDGLQPFKDLCERHNITDDLFKKTLVVKTGSGGFHLYFKLPENIGYMDVSQRSLTGGLDVRTHQGYVIAAGTNGYEAINHVEPMELPEGFLEEMKRKAVTKAETFNPEKALPAKELKAVLKKIDVKSFDTNDIWQEFVTSIIATSGNSPEILDIIEEWSKGDSEYADDSTIRTRLETFEPDGGITAGTFLFTVKPEISKYLYNKIRMLVGSEFTFSTSIADNFNLPFSVSYEIIHEEKTIMESFYYKKHQMFGADIFARLVEGKLLYVMNEKCFYYFNGTYWKAIPGVQDIIFTAFLRAGLVFYTDYSEGKDEDANELFNDYVSFLGSLSMLQKFEQAMKQHPLVTVEQVPWDRPELTATLTLKDSVMDFSSGYIQFREGRADEYRRSIIELTQKDFEGIGQPVKFKEFLKDVFPDTDTRKTATYALSAMLSGTGKFRKFQIWNGSGNNGKSALLDIMTHVIGEERAVPYTPEDLLSTEKLSPLTPELARFRGSLVAFASETNEFKNISEGAVKRLTGDEPITANPKFQKPIHFHTTWQMVLATNHLPTFRAHDIAFINRLLIIPFYTNFYTSEEMKEAAKRRGSRYFKPAADGVEMKNAIKQERASILMYLAKRYTELGRDIPESAECKEARLHYIKENNDIAELVTEMLELGESYFTPTKDIVDFYNTDQNTRYTSKYIVRRIKEIFPTVDNHSKRVNGKLTRGLRGIRLIYGAYPEGYMGNFTDAERAAYAREEDNEEGAKF